MDVGAHLRSSREAQGISLALLAARTRVQPRILAAIELNDLQGIPPKPFGRGFIRAYAHEVGLDPERIVHDYFGQFAPAAPAHPTAPSVAPPLNERAPWMVPAALAVVLAIGAFALLRSDVRTTSEADVANVVGTSGLSTPPAATPAAATAAAPAADRMTLVVRADRDSWVTASTDGRRVLYQILPAGSERTLQATREVVIRAGDAGALRLTLNGRELGAFGGSGEVRQARITSANAATFRATAAR